MACETTRSAVGALLRGDPNTRRHAHETLSAAPASCRARHSFLSSSSPSSSCSDRRYHRTIRKNARRSSASRITASLISLRRVASAQCRGCAPPSDAGGRIFMASEMPGCVVERLRVGKSRNNEIKDPISPLFLESPRCNQRENSLTGLCFFFVAYDSGRPFARVRFVRRNRARAISARLPPMRFC